MLQPAARVLEDATQAPSPPVDRARLQHMFDAHHALVWRTLRRRGLDADAAADATQQVFLIATERLGDIRSGSERAFLIGTALRLARSISRRTARVQLEDDMDLRAAAAKSTSEDRAAVEIFDRVIGELDPTLTEVFVLFELSGFSSPEISQLLAIPVGTVASRLRRAREEFRSVARRIELSLRRENNP